ncbi:MAG: hypothetical protein NC311_10440 [Muribaculaceae bacterium]|nr:hypothetical protein [Muribaculaceae bacterium]
MEIRGLVVIGTGILRTDLDLELGHFVLQRHVAEADDGAVAVGGIRCVLVGRADGDAGRIVGGANGQVSELVEAIHQDAVEVVFLTIHCDGFADVVQLVDPAVLLGILRDDVVVELGDVVFGGDVDEAQAVVIVDTGQVEGVDPLGTLRGGHHDVNKGFLQAHVVVGVDRRVGVVEAVGQPGQAAQIDGEVALAGAGRGDAVEVLLKGGAHSGVIAGIEDALAGLIAQAHRGVGVHGGHIDLHPLVVGAHALFIEVESVAHAVVDSLGRNGAPVAVGEDLFLVNVEAVDSDDLHFAVSHVEFLDAGGIVLMLGGQDSGLDAAHVDAEVGAGSAHGNLAGPATGGGGAGDGGFGAIAVLTANLHSAALGGSDDQRLVALLDIGGGVNVAVGGHSLAFKGNTGQGAAHIGLLQVDGIVTGEGTVGGTNHDGDGSAVAGAELGGHINTAQGLLAVGHDGGVRIVCLEGNHGRSEIAVHIHSVRAAGGQIHALGVL